MARGVILDPDISADYVRSLLSYDPATGVLRWKVDRAGKARAGMVAGFVGHGGYVLVKLVKRSLRAHRVIWLMVTGAWPEMGLDHRDNDKANNRWGNLRIATGAENARNKPRHSDKASACPKGVYPTRDGKFTSVITVNYQSIYLGRFLTPEEGSAAYALAVKKYHGEYGRIA